MSLDLPWLAEAWTSVARALAAGRLPAGLLILGRPGLGRGRLATAIAQARLCEQPRADRQACGVCGSCRLVLAGTHPDLLRVTPLEDKKNLGIDQIRELGGTLALTAGRQGARCAILAPADRLTREAANALLKTLEEPSPSVTLILIATSAGTLPSTVCSRCLRLAVPVPGSEEALTWLAAHAPRNDWPLLLALAAGAPLAAEQLIEEGITDAARFSAQIIAAAAGRTDPITVLAQYSGWPLVRVAALLAWLAQCAFRIAAIGEESGSDWSRELSALAVRADVRMLARVWREATALTVEDTALNVALARERLILLFVDAFHRPTASDGILKRGAALVLSP
ncbi:MAG: DNA polymerase III subunit delta' [Gammaproteobacteria bacterium]